MALTKRCFICAHKENDGNCTNKDCPRCVASTTTETTGDTASTENTDTP